MKQIDNLNILEYQWNEIRNSVMEVNQELAQVIDDLNPDSEYKIFEASYRYGDLILNEGRFFLPLKNGSTVPLEHRDVPTHLKKNLQYSSAPIGLISKNTVEVFIECGLDVIPLVTFESGRILGLLETLDPVGAYCLRYIWSSCAGARSVCMLPKISDKVSHSRLQKDFNLTLDAPTNYFEHFNVFRELSRSSDFLNDSWRMKILFFSENWLSLEPFNEYLRRYMIKNSSYARNKATFDVLWHFFSKELTFIGKKPNPYILDTLKHVVKILIGVSPGYAPVLDDVTRGPFYEIQKIYLESYRLSSVPTIMVPYHFDIESSESQPVFHSMNNPSMFETIPKMRETESLITDLVQTSSLFKNFYELGKSGKLRIEKTILEKVFNQTELLFYHANPNNSYFGIRQSQDIPKADKRFSALQCLKKDHSLKFSDNGEFVKSCILIRNKVEQ
jgi:hypothetical protein